MTTPSEIPDEAGDETEAWRCSCCGELKSNGLPDSSWRGVYRADGTVAYWQHSCPPNHPQAGWFDAVNFGAGRVPKPKAEQPSAEEPAIVQSLRAMGRHDDRYLTSESLASLLAYIDSLKPVPSADVVERVAKAIERACPNFATEFCRHIARAALSAIPQPAEPK